MGELCHLQSALETCRKSIQLLAGLTLTVPSPVEEELTGRGRRWSQCHSRFKWTEFPGEQSGILTSDDSEGHTLALSWQLRTGSPFLADLTFTLSALDRMFMSQTLMTMMHDLPNLPNCLRHPPCWPAGRETSRLCWNLLCVSEKEAQLGVQPLGLSCGQQHNLRRGAKRMRSWTSLGKKIPYPFATKYHIYRITSEWAIQ